MPVRAVQHAFGPGATYDYADVGAYDPDKTGLGFLMTQKNDAGNGGKWVGPHPIIKTLATKIGNNGHINNLVNWSDDKVFFIIPNFGNPGEVMLFSFVLSTYTLAYIGHIAPGGVNGHRSAFLELDVHNTGTVEVAGTAVSGSGTAWQTDRIAEGARIGFGTTDHTAVSTWYEIQTINADGSITLTSSAGSIAAGTPYVIYEFRIFTLLNQRSIGVVKGLHEGVFDGRSVPTSNTDNQRATYILNQASPVIVAVAGAVLEPKIDNSTQYVWMVANNSIAPGMKKFNVRTLLTSLVAGETEEAFLFAEDTGPPSEAVSCFAHTHDEDETRFTCVNGTISTALTKTGPLSDIRSANDSAFMMAASARTPYTQAGSAQNLLHCDWAHAIEAFLVHVTPTNTSAVSLATRFNTDGSPCERAYYCTTNQSHGALVDASAPSHPHYIGSAASFSRLCSRTHSSSGLTFVFAINGPETDFAVYVVPLQADWEYAETTKARVVTPRMRVRNASALRKAVASSVRTIGGATGYNLGLQPEGFRLLARTAGIEDDSGAWTSVPSNGDISGLDTTSGWVQLAIEYKTMGPFGIPSRVCAVAVTFDAEDTERFQSSQASTDTDNRRFAWRFATAYGGPVDLRVKLYDAASGKLLYEDDSAAPVGTWEQSTDGGDNWVAFDGDDKDGDLHYLRYTAPSIPNSVRIRAVLSAE